MSHFLVLWGSSGAPLMKKKIFLPDYIFVSIPVKFFVNLTIEFLEICVYSVLPSPPHPQHPIMMFGLLRPMRI